MRAGHALLLCQPAAAVLADGSPACLAALRHLSSSVQNAASSSSVATDGATAANTSDTDGTSSTSAVVVDQHGGSSSSGGLLQSSLLHDAAAATSYAELAASVFRSTEEVIGPLSLGDLVFGLQAVAKKHREQQLAYCVEGRPVHDRALIAALLEASDLAYAAYKINPQSACAVSHLRLHNLRKFVPHNTQLRPAYFLAVDHVTQTIIWAIRGTKNVSDVITDISSSSTPLDGGRVHWGILQASRALMKEELGHLTALTKACAGYRLLLVGHSLGAGVAAMVAYCLNTRPSLRRQLRCCPSITAVAVAPPPVMSEGLAAASEPFVTSLVYSHDPVPRLSPAAVSRLRNELLGVDWASQLRSSVLEAEYTQAITNAISTAGSGTAQAAAQLQKLATELLQSEHLKDLSSALSSVVYGRARQAAAEDAAAAAAGSSADGSSVAGAAAAAAAEHATAWYLQQQHEEEMLQIQQWQQQLRQWQKQQKQKQQQGRESDQQQQQLQAWQVDVIRSWMADVSQKLLPFVKGVPLPDADIKRVADAAVQSLTSSLGSIGSSIGSIAWGSSSSSSSSSSSARQEAEQQTTSSSSEAAGTDSGWHFEKLPEQKQQETMTAGTSAAAAAGAPWTGLQAAAGQIMTVISNAGQLLISIGPAIGSSSSSSSGTGGSSGSGVKDSSSSDGLFGFTADSMLQYWSVRDKPQQLDGSSADSSNSTAAALLGAADGSSDSSTSSGWADQAEAAAASTAAAAASAMAALPTGADLAAAIKAAADVTMGAAPAAVAEAAKATTAAAAASAAAAGAAAAAEVVNLYPPGRLLFLMRQDLLRQRPPRPNSSSKDTSSTDTSSSSSSSDMRSGAAGADALSPSSAAAPASPLQPADQGPLQPQRQLPAADDEDQEGQETHLGAAKAAAAAALGRLRLPSGSSSGSSSTSSAHRASGSSSSSALGSSGGTAGLAFDPQVPFASSANRAGAESSSCRHVLLEVARAGHFDELVLHPDMFGDHRTRSYRAALLDLLKKQPAAR